MLIGFLIQSEADWKQWRQLIASLPGKAIIHVADREPSMASPGIERESAIDEVETLDDDSE
jgi:cysteine protease ATG4